MLKELLDDTIDFLKEEIPEFRNRVERYKNQLENPGNDVFPVKSPVCYLELIEAVPISRDAQLESTNKKYTFRALVCGGIHVPVSDTAEKLFDKLDATDVEIAGRSFDFVCERIFLVGWFGFVSCYEVHFTAE